MPPRHTDCGAAGHPSEPSASGTWAPRGRNTPESPSDPVRFNHSGRVGIGQDHMQHLIPGRVPGVASVTLPHHLPRPGLFPRQIPPRTGYLVGSGKQYLDDLTVVSKRMPLLPFIRGQQGLDPIPLLVAELPEP